MNRKDIELLNEARYGELTPGSGRYDDTPKSRFGELTPGSGRFSDEPYSYDEPVAPKNESDSLNAPEGYEVSYDGDTLTIARTVNGMHSTTMTRMGKKPIDEVQKHVDSQVAFDQYDMARRTPASKQQLLAKQKQIWSK